MVVRYSLPIGHIVCVAVVLSSLIARGCCYNVQTFQFVPPTPELVTANWLCNGTSRCCRLPSRFAPLVVEAGGSSGCIAGSSIRSGKACYVKCASRALANNEQPTYLYRCTSDGQLILPTLTCVRGPVSGLPRRYQGIYLKSWDNGWDEPGILDMFTPASRRADIAFLSFLRPVPQGLDCPGDSACAMIWSDTLQRMVPASTLYRKCILEARAKYSLRTLLAIGGWEWRDQFAFLASMTPTQLEAWALKVKAKVDEFGANGIDVDYETETSAQWINELYRPNVFRYLRAAMPSPKYLITFTIGSLRAAAGTSRQVLNAFNPPITDQDSMVGIALRIIRQNWGDLDRIQIMTYDEQPNMDPRVCLNLTLKGMIGFGADAADAASRLAMGAEPGPQSGGCTNTREGWCKQEDKLLVMATDVVRKGYGGFFYWSNLSRAASMAAYNATYAVLRRGLTRK